MLSILKNAKEQPASSTNFSTSMGSNTVKEGKNSVIASMEGNRNNLSIEKPEYSQINEKTSEEEKSSDERFSGKF